MNTEDIQPHQVSILQPLAVRCDHANSSYMGTASDRCNYSLGRGREHVLKSLTKNSCI